MTTAQALAGGLTKRQLRTLRAAGWGHAARGVYVCPDAPDPFRASVKAALLVCPLAVVCGMTAARLHGLWGLPIWSAAEVPHLLYPAGRSYNARSGVHLHSGLRAGEAAVIGGFPVTKLGPTLAGLARVLRLDDLVCALDSALRLGLQPESSGLRPKLRKALVLADARSESPLETVLRLLLARAGLAPEVLQFEVRDSGGHFLARLDMAWPSAMLAVEADGRAYHDAPDALYRDRARANALALEGWTVLRFTWADVMGRPEWVVAQVRRALARRPN